MGDRVAPKLGLGANWRQFGVYSFITVMVGATIGVERVALPPLASAAFGVRSVLLTVSFLVPFGLTKAIGNLVAGHLSDHHGRRTILRIGWLFGFAYAVGILAAHAWWEVLAANAVLGCNQALTWTMAVTAKIDLVGPSRRALAVGIDEAAGYVGVGLGGLGAGLLLGEGARSAAPWILALVVVGVGAVVSVWPARETRGHALVEAAADQGGLARSAGPTPSLLHLAWLVSWRDRALAVVSVAGMLTKFADSLMAAFVPLVLLHEGDSVTSIGLIVGVYLWVWGLLQVPTGLLADAIGRRWPVVGGTILIGVGLGFEATAHRPGVAVAAAVVTGVGMALAYPNLIAIVGDRADPHWRGGALGVYRLWRDGGYAVGPLVLGVVAEVLGVRAAVDAGAALLVAWGVVMAVTLPETQPGHGAVSRRTR